MVDFAHQVAKGMEYLASRKVRRKNEIFYNFFKNSPFFQKVTHGYLAACNVLIDVHGILKITDCGAVLRDVHAIETCFKSEAVKWMAPEFLGHRVYTIQSDVWSFGILLWEIVSLGDSPYPGLANTEKLFELICEGLRMEQPIGSSTKL